MRGPHGFRLNVAFSLGDPVHALGASLAHLTSHLRHGARVVLFGAKGSRRRFGWLLNSALNFAMTRFWLPTTPGIDAEPWQLAAEHLEELVVEDRFDGWMLLASGSLRPRLSIDS